jgi:hypothetical protein
MNQEDLIHKSHELGLILNQPEPALVWSGLSAMQICLAIQFAEGFSKHLAGKQAIPASELVSYTNSPRLPKAQTNCPLLPLWILLPQEEE